MEQYSKERQERADLEATSYSKPEVKDHGTLQEMTKAHTGPVSTDFTSWIPRVS